MRCGVCKEEGVTVDHVKSCYANKYNPEQVKAPLWPASEPQIDYVLSLQSERILPEQWKVYEKDVLKTKERDEVSGIITMLKEFPHRDKSKVQREWDMPAGRYAICWENDGEDEWWFYLVDKPTEGRWKGYTFIKRLIGSPGDYKKVSLSQDDRFEALEAIEEDPKQAMIDYGLQTKVCGRCGSPLTDPDSRARGIGPICAMKEW